MSNIEQVVMALAGLALVVLVVVSLVLWVVQSICWLGESAERARRRADVRSSAGRGQRGHWLADQCRERSIFHPDRPPGGRNQHGRN